MKRLTLIASLIASLALAPLALAQDGPPAGTYTAKIAAPPPLKGTWAVSFVKGNGGVYTIAQNGKVVVRGRFLSIGSQIQFSRETGSKACKASGYYNWKRTGKTLRFSKLSDPGCAGRALVLAHAFKLA